jgi:AraC-like DNA-binding protein
MAGGARIVSHFASYPMSKPDSELLSVVPPGTGHRVQGQRTISYPSVTVDILATRRIELVEWSLRRFADPYWRLYWPLTPGGEVEIAGRVTALKPGRMYLIPPHTVFSTVMRRPFAKWYAHFKLSRLADRAAPGIYAFPITETTSALVDQLEKGTPRMAFPWPAIELVTQALRMLPAEVWSANRTDTRVVKALEFMSDHLALKISAEMISKHAGVSVRNLNHLFQKQFQQAPMRILLDYRLDEACRQLRNTDESIETIAEACGLVNRHYFSRMLRQYRNTSPAAYRQQTIE